MNIERRKKLVEYLFPNESARKFICNDLLFEIASIVNIADCISQKNIPNSARWENHNKVKMQIKTFLKKNQAYLNVLTKIYVNMEFDEIVDNIVIAYIYYLINDNYKYRNIDIFRNKKSICYSPISIIDI